MHCSRWIVQTVKENLDIDFIWSDVHTVTLLQNCEFILSTVVSENRIEASASLVLHTVAISATASPAIRDFCLVHWVGLIYRIKRFVYGTLDHSWIYHNGCCEAVVNCQVKVKSELTRHFWAWIFLDIDNNRVKALVCRVLCEYSYVWLMYSTTFSEGSKLIGRIC